MPRERPAAKGGLMCVLALALLLALPVITLAGDPTGATTGAASDVTAKTAGEPTLQEVAAELGHTKIAVNFVWALIAAFLVMFMQAGFALAETGFTRAKNAAHTMAMNLMCYGLGILGFWVCGYALEDRVNCRLVEPGDVEAFERTLLETLTGADAATALGIRARETVERNFSWERYTDALWELLFPAT